MREAAGLGFAAVCSVWIVLTLVCQGRSRVAAAIRRHDVFGLIPLWTFFAPTPGTQDYVLLRRCRTADGRLTQWRELGGADATGQPLCTVWNPARRHAKALLDAAQSLLELASRVGRPEEIELSAPYLALLAHVSAQPCSEEACATQFALVIQKSSAYEEAVPAVAFVSSLHEID
ncbi:hypothetical protein [Streptomyces omiyaensis]|uniref:hypothetical protein n=1 Tax=Streptomyces omiyaensis TaxID=68247 RepID=UPI00198B4A2F|nr:hypothetical protein GCM10010363_46740 [Streptomyces omiyaensis]